MDPSNFKYRELAPATAPGVCPYEYPEHYMFDYEALNRVGHLHFGGVSYGYNPTINEPSPARYMANMYQSHACDPMVYATNSLPYDPQYSSILPTFQRGLSLEESTPRAYNFQGPGGIALQPGCLRNDIGANQSNIHCQSFYNNGGCRVSTNSYYLPHSPANAKFVSLRPNMVDGCLSRDYSVNGRTWTGVEQGITVGMYPRASSDQFGVSPMPNSQLQHYFPRINDSVPSSSNQQTKSGQTPLSKPTHPSNKFEPPIKSGIQKASNPKSPAPSSCGISKTSAPLQVWQEKKKKKKTTQPSASQTGPPTKLTEPVYHVTWDGIDEEYEHFEQNCPLCDKDLSNMPSAEDDSDYYDDVEPLKFPDVAVLPCGHAFHSDCLQLYTPEDQSRDPPCFLCFSSLSPIIFN